MNKCNLCMCRWFKCRSVKIFLLKLEVEPPNLVKNSSAFWIYDQNADGISTKWNAQGVFKSYFNFRNILFQEPNYNLSVLVLCQYHQSIRGRNFILFYVF